MFFDEPTALVRVAVVGISCYVLLVAVLRVSGKRTLAKLNAFDLVVTVAIGSTLSSALISQTVTVSQGVAAFVVLVGLQFVVSRTSMSFGRFRRLVTSEPTVVVVDGRLRSDVMARERLSEDAIRATLRQAGVGELQAVAAVVLETDGSLSVIPRSHLGAGWSLRGVRGWSDPDGGGHGDDGPAASG